MSKAPMPTEKNQHFGLPQVRLIHYFKPVL